MFGKYNLNFKRCRQKFGEQFGSSVLRSLEQLELWSSNNFRVQNSEFGPSLVLTVQFDQTSREKFGHCFGQSLLS